MTRLQRLHAIKAWRRNQPIRWLPYNDTGNEAAMIDDPGLNAFLDWLDGRVGRYPTANKPNSCRELFDGYANPLVVTRDNASEFLAVCKKVLDEQPTETSHATSD